MTHKEVKLLFVKLKELAAYCIQNKVTNFYLNYALNKNLENFASAIRMIDKSTNAELKEIEKEAFMLANPDSKSKESIDKLIVKGFGLLSEEKKVKHTELMLQYEEDMKGNNDIQIYYIDPEKIQNIEMDYEHVQMLTSFLKPLNEKKMKCDDLPDGGGGGVPQPTKPTNP